MDAATAQLRKLGIGPDTRWLLDGAPTGWAFETAPDAANRVDAGPADVAIAFVCSAAEVDATLERLERSIFPAGALWVAWPRRAGGHESDVTDEVVRRAALARRLVDTKVAAVDQDWSGLKLVWRREARGV